MEISHWVLLYIAAWFIQMGAHEGAHAYAAAALGDDTAALQGKRSFNPFAHIDWNDLNSILFAVVAPVFTAWPVRRFGIPHAFSETTCRSPQEARFL